jgi:hypothetical protein
MSWSMTSVHEADVAPIDVYRYYADPTTWGEWGHNTRWGRPVGPVQPGATVEVRVANYPHTYHVKVRDVQEGRRVVCEVKPVGVTIVSTYDVTPAEGGSRLHHTIEISGRLERGYRLLEGQYSRMLREETRRLAELVRSQRGAVAP